MSYVPTAGVLDTALSAADLALRVKEDPALPTVVSLVQEIKTLSSKGSKPTTEPGVGLSRIVTPLRGFVAYKRHPWIVPAFIGGTVLGIFALGVMTGRRRK